jgi:hypothetical protein
LGCVWIVALFWVLFVLCNVFVLTALCSCFVCCTPQLKSQARPIWVYLKRCICHACFQCS